jgi:hypothetical protein
MGNEAHFCASTLVIKSSTDKSSHHTSRAGSEDTKRSHARRGIIRTAEQRANTYPVCPVRWCPPSTKSFPLQTLGLTVKLKGPKIQATRASGDGGLGRMCARWGSVRMERAARSRALPRAEDCQRHKLFERVGLAITIARRFQAGTQHRK